jgi:hypothetical protein
MTTEHNPGEPEFGDHDEDAPHNPGEPKFDPDEEAAEQGSDVPEVESGDAPAGGRSEEVDKAQEREGEASEG